MNMIISVKAQFLNCPRERGVYLATSPDCTFYYRCENRFLRVQACFPWQKFDIHTLRCSRRWEVDCNPMYAGIWRPMFGSKPPLGVGGTEGGNIGTIGIPLVEIVVEPSLEEDVENSESLLGQEIPEETKVTRPEISEETKVTGQEIPEKTKVTGHEQVGMGVSPLITENSLIDGEGSQFGQAMPDGKGAKSQAEADAVKGKQSIAENASRPGDDGAPINNLIEEIKAFENSKPGSEKENQSIIDIIETSKSIPKELQDKEKILMETETTPEGTRVNDENYALEQHTKAISNPISSSPKIGNQIANESMSQERLESKPGDPTKLEKGGVSDESTTNPTLNRSEGSSELGFPATVTQVKSPPGNSISFESESPISKQEFESGGVNLEEKMSTENETTDDSAVGNAQEPQNSNKDSTDNETLKERILEKRSSENVEGESNDNFKFPEPETSQSLSNKDSQNLDEENPLNNLKSFSSEWPQNLARIPQNTATGSTGKIWYWCGSGRFVLAENAEEGDSICLQLPNPESINPEGSVPSGGDWAGHTFLGTNDEFA